MYTYKIEGTVTFNDADTDDGLATIEINEIVETGEMSAQSALDKFLQENEQYEFYGSLKTCDAETRGKKCATFKDQNEDQTIEVELLGK